MRLTGSNPLSTQDDVAAGLASMGVETFGIHGASPEEYQQHLTETLKCHPHLVIDDGGDLIDLLGGQCQAYADCLIGGVDVLISNAGISIRKLFRDTDFAQWKKVMGVNLDGMYLCAKEAVLRMEPQQTGVILFTASTNGMEGHPFYADYNASKAAVILLGRTLALECAPWLRVNSICPGYVLTPMQKAEYTEEMLEKVNEGIPMKRHADPEEVAALFAFLASDEAKYITGQHIPIDGGETA